jgi:hypothetical protein
MLEQTVVQFPPPFQGGVSREAWRGGWSDFNLQPPPLANARYSPLKPPHFRQAINKDPGLGGEAPHVSNLY